ncbi:MAG: hypothetical protein H6557_33395 [Lewinellaceae bacterium]|nr:hypothetical protein [Phaeodactylibacter sp.]MCB9041538.1 hypothetical protein [Lewinellaceae bacterium]
MQKLLRLVRLDLSMILREEMLWFMLFVVPALQFSAALLLLPWLEEQFPVMAEYHLLVVMLMTLQVVTSIGFVLASMLLDERDEEVLTALRAMPVGVNAFLFYRLGIGTVMAVLFACAMLSTPGPEGLGWASRLTAAALFASAAPITTLALATLSSNKVEGLAVYKGISLILILPAGSFFIDSWVQYALGIVPVYWTLHFLDNALTGKPAIAELVMAILTHGLALSFLFRLFKQKVFS